MADGNKFCNSDSDGVPMVHVMLGLPMDKLKDHFKRFSACCP